MYAQALRRRTWTRSLNACSNRGNKKLVCLARPYRLLSFQECILTLPLLVVQFYWLSWRLTLTLFLFIALSPCPTAIEHATIALLEMLKHLYTKRWIWFLFRPLPSSRSPASWITSPRSSFLFFRNSWTTNKTFLLPGIFQTFLKPFINFFLIYKFLPGSLWKTTLLKTLPWELVLWFLWLQLPRMQRINCYSLHSNTCIAFVHCLTDLLAQHSYMGYGNIILILCRHRRLTSVKCRYSSIFLNAGILNNAMDLTLVVTTSCLEHPALLAGCVCTFSKEVKPVFCLDDLLHERISFQFSPLAFTWWTGVNEYFLQFWMSRGCQGHQWVWHQRRHSLFACDLKKGRFLHVPASTTWTWWSNFVWLGSFLVFLFQAVGLQLQRNIFFHDFGTWCLSFCTSV